MSSYKFINPIFKAKVANTDSDFSSFVPVIPLTREKLLIEKCKKQDVSIYVDDPSEQSDGDYAIFRSVASEVELERRLNAKKAIILSKCANVIAFATFIAAMIPFIVPILHLAKLSY